MVRLQLAYVQNNVLPFSLGWEDIHLYIEEVRSILDLLCLLLPFKLTWLGLQPPLEGLACCNQQKILLCKYKARRIQNRFKHMLSSDLLQKTAELLYWLCQILGIYAVLTSLVRPPSKP